MKKVIKLSVLTLASGIMFTGCATTAQTDSTNTNSTKPTSVETTKIVDVTPKKDGNRKICKRSVPTGSRFAVKDCKTADEWEAIREASRKTTREFQRTSAQSGNPRGG